MADQQLKKRVDEDAGPGYTSWSVRGNTAVEYAYPRGRVGRFLAKFFATPAVDKVAPDYYEKQGDAIINPNQELRSPARLSMTKSQLPFLPEIEINRKRRYEEFERMDDYPEVTAAFDIYADESTQKDIKNKRWVIKSESTKVVKEIEKLYKKIKLHRTIWDIVRNTVKYGDCFGEIIMDLADPERGVTRFKILNPSYIVRIEDSFGYLEKFLQEIPTQDSMMGQPMEEMGRNNQYIELDRNQIIHFRLHTSDPKMYPYGKSIATGSVKVFRSLQLMEEAMIIYRIARAPERRIFYVDVGKLPATRAEAFIEDIKARYKKEKFVANNNVDGRYNPLGPDEDYFIPTYDNGRGTKIETLPGGQNLGEVDDVKYFRDKLLATLKIPKDYMVEFDKSPERKANLAQLDVKFARTIIRIQEAVSVGLEAIAKRHLKLKGYPQTLINDLTIELPDPSDIFTKRKLEIDEAKARVVQAVIGTGLFPTEIIYKEYYDMNDSEIESLKKKLEKDRKDQNKLAMEQGAEQGAQPGIMDVGTPGTVGPAGEAPMPPQQPADQMATKEEITRYFAGQKKKNTKLISLIEGYLPTNSKLSSKAKVSSSI